MSTIKIDPKTGAPIVIPDALLESDFAPLEKDISPDEEKSDPTVKPDEPPPTVEHPLANTPVTESTKMVESELDNLNKKIYDILKAYGSEQNIPVNHEYWDLRNRVMFFRSSK